LSIVKFPLIYSFINIVDLAQDIITLVTTITIITITFIPITNTILLLYCYTITIETITPTIIPTTITTIQLSFLYRVPLLHGY